MFCPKLLFFVAEDWYFCSHRLPLAVAAKEAGFDVVVVTRVRAHGDIILNSGLRLIPVKMSRRGMNPLRELGVLFTIWRIYRQERPDIVHHVAIKPVLYGSVVAWLTGCRDVINAMAGLGYLFNSRRWTALFLRFWVIWLFRILFSRAGSKLIVQNPDDVNYFIRNGLIDSEKVVLIRGAGVDTDVFVPASREPSGPPVVMLASRLLWDKGVKEFVEAAGMLRRQGVDARFVLVGDSDFENPAAISPNQLKIWQETGDVEWWGYQDDMPEVLIRSHLVCLPSYHEGLPKILLETASCGKPIVAADVSGCREIVRHGENGLLVPVRDSGSLAVAIKALLDAPELRHRMGVAGRRLVEQEFAQEIVIEQTLRLYREMLS